MEGISDLVDRVAMAVILRRVRSARSDSAETSPGLTVGPETFYALPDGVTEVEVGAPRGLLLRARELVYRSPLRTGHAANDTVRCRYYAAGSAGNPAVVLLHGWMAASFFFYAPLIRRLLSSGMDVVVMQLPYHMSRAPAGSFSGQHALCGSLSMTRESVRQGVLDARILFSWLRARCGGPVGVLGISLGGLIGAILASIEKNLDFCILMMPAADLAELFWESAIGREMLIEEASSADRRELVRDYFRVITPRCLTPSVSVENIVIVQSRNDRIVPPFVVRDLWEAWGRPSRVLSDRGHILTTVRTGVVGEILPRVSCLSDGGRWDRTGRFIASRWRGGNGVSSPSAAARSVDKGSAAGTEWGTLREAADEEDTHR